MSRSNNCKEEEEEQQEEDVSYNECYRKLSSNFCRCIESTISMLNVVTTNVNIDGHNDGHDDGHDDEHEHEHESEHEHDDLDKHLNVSNINNRNSPATMKTIQISRRRSKRHKQ